MVSLLYSIGGVVGGIIAVYLVFMFLIVPLMIRGSMKQSARFPFISYNPYETPPPALVLQEINQYYHALEPLGFKLVAYLFQEGQVKNCMAYLTMLANEQTGDTAAITTIRTEVAGMPATITSYLEFSKDYQDDVQVNTLNSNVALGTYYPRPGKTAFQLPSIRDAAELFAAHRLFVRQYGSQGAPSSPLPTPANAITELQKGMRKDLDYQVERGLMTLDQSDQTYKATLWGAYRMTWKHLPPVYQIRRARRFRHDLGLLRALRANPSSTMAGATTNPS